MSELDPYEDADLYDVEYANHTEDVGFYVDVARQRSGRVLELGCGTGRLTIRMARAGATVLGVDRSAAMLDRLREKLARETAELCARVTVIERDYHGDDPLTAGGFATILWPFNALHHCADEDQLRTLLGRAHRWAEPGARLVLDAYLLDRSLYDRDPDARYEPRTFVHPRTGETLESWEQGWWDEGAQTHHVVYVYVRPDGVEHRVHLRLRMFGLPVLRRALADTGWKLARELQDFRGTPLAARALKWVAVADRG